jgi:hypothetical protein
MLFKISIRIAEVLIFKQGKERIISKITIINIKWSLKTWSRSLSIINKPSYLNYKIT